LETETAKASMAKLTAIKNMVTNSK